MPEDESGKIDTAPDVGAADAFFNEHQFAAGLRGDFLRLVVDGGDDVCVYRIVEDFGAHPDGSYVRRIELFLVPVNHIVEFLAKHPEVRMISRSLEHAIEIGVAK